jgi:radical SAM superfamily enzyme YgiQ (UPF0313 family)
MSDIVLATLNSKYIHSSFGLRCLWANLKELAPRSVIFERDAQLAPTDVVEQLLSLKPRVIGLGVYIWNVSALTQVVQLLKRVDPEVFVVLGGPEVSHELEGQPIVDAADYVICGEADAAFAALAAALLGGEKPAQKVIRPPLPDLKALVAPYPAYSDEDIAHRVIYVEASRGCPYRCEFCLSSLDDKVRAFPLAPFLTEMKRLLERGVRQFKFVDRTFNLNIDTSRSILQFFLDEMREGLFVHFEMIPDRLPPALRELIARFPPGALQFEVGVQTLNPQVEGLVSRRQSHERLRDNFRFLREETGVHVHADLIAGLPGETVESFGAGFDALWAMQPHEIQVGVLKRLKGTPISRHDGAHAMKYAPSPPFEVLQTAQMDFATVQVMKRFSRYWNLFGNSGHFRNTLPLILEGQSPFSAFSRFSAWLHQRLGHKHGIALLKQFELVFEYLTKERGFAAAQAGASLALDFGPHRTDIPGWLKPFDTAPATLNSTARLPKRQARHLS